jgi:glycogen(starch) synthase
MFGWEFPPHNSGGLGTACYGLTKGLKNYNVSVTFVLPRKVDVDADFVKVIFGDETDSKHYLVNSLLQAYSTSDSYELRLSAAKDDASKAGLIYGSNLFEEVERYGIIGGKIAAMEDFDIIHAHDWLTFKAAMAAKRVSGKYLIVHVHATEFDRTGGNGVNQYVYEIEKKGMEEADKVIAVSNYTKQKIVEHYGIDPDKIQVVHNAIDFEDYAMTKIHELKRNNKVVLFLGRITLQKGPDYFVHAAKRVIEYYPNVIFVIVGSGDMERAIIRKVAELGIADKFVFTGFLRGNDNRAVYQMADLYVMPSVSEPFGLTPLESLMNGTPVLISKQSGVSEVINHCLKSDFWDIDDMANKIVSVLKHDELRRCLRDNGTQEVRKFSWNTPAERCVNIYNELLRSKK